MAFSRGSPKKGLSVPKASEWSRTETRDSGGSPPQIPAIAATTSARFSSSAALTLKNSARRPVARISLDDPVGVGLRRLAVEVDAEDVPARPAERERARLAEPGRSAQDEGPAVAGFGGQSGGILVHSPPVDPRQRWQEPPGSRRARALAALLLLLAVVWLEPAGSGLAEPDETRYAEIPREMLAAGRPAGAAPERRPLLREASPALLGQRRVAAGLRRDAVGGAPADAPGGVRDACSSSSWRRAGR